MIKNAPWHAKFAALLACLIPFYFMLAALGTKFGLWSWQTGLGGMTIGAGPMLLGIVGLVSLVSLIAILWRAPRNGWPLSLFGLLFPLGIFGYVASVGSVAAEHPIHDVATDTTNPPSFSADTMAARDAGDSNPLNDYSTPLSDIEMWSSSEEPLASQTHAGIIADTYPDLTSIDTSGLDQDIVATAVADAMGALGFSNVTTSDDKTRIEGVAETFWFGFKDDVVVRNSDGMLDIRSVSRVGRSDLGANAKRIAALRAEIEQRLSQ
ncbi:hypothetical protein BPTFM16_00528 [Altererythrobacter insulae]|nr:hypothetical protein BPTFM16_00528 [Altererythrobacter insulae]